MGSSETFFSGPGPFCRSCGTHFGVRIIVDPRIAPIESRGEEAVKLRSAPEATTYIQSWKLLIAHHSNLNQFLQDDNRYVTRNGLSTCE